MEKSLKYSSVFSNFNQFELMFHTFCRQSQSTSPFDDFLQLSPTDELPDIENLSSLQLCEECAMRHKACPKCKLFNQPLSIEKANELEIMRNLIYVRKDSEGGEFLEVRYPLTVQYTSYKSELSNYKQAQKSSERLKVKLQKRGLIESYDKEMRKAISEQHIKALSPAEATEIMNSPHSFQFINYVQKDAAGHKIRPVLNSSCPHPGPGPLNSNVLTGPNLLNSLYKILVTFLLSPFYSHYGFKSRVPQHPHGRDHQ